jgi:excisionase family DNA binding protein
MSTITEIRPGSVLEQDLNKLIDLFEAPQAQRIDPSPRLVGADGTSVEVPFEIFELLTFVVNELKAGNGVSIVPLHAELTTVEAADILNVSRPHLIKQLESGALPYRLVGSHRRIRLVDVLAYRDQQDAEASASLDQMVRDAERFGLYD